MKNNVIISSLAASLIVAAILGFSASADYDNAGESEKVFKKWWFERLFWDDFGWKQKFKKGKAWFMKSITDEEKTALESMDDEEKKAFFEAKKVERKAEKEAKKIERLAHENVIDKLLAWETLTSDEETLRSEIIEKRAERKLQREAREAEMGKIKTIMEKKKAWEDLSEEEEAKLDEVKWKKWGKKGHMCERR